MLAILTRFFQSKPVIVIEVNNYGTPVHYKFFSLCFLFSVVNLYPAIHSVF